MFLHLSVILFTGGAPPGQDTPQADTPWAGRHPPGQADTLLGRHPPLGRCPLADTPLGRHPP